MDVATLVRNITAAFEDATDLVERIRKRKEQDPNAQIEPIDDLLDSLSLGPTVVRGYYESDAKRFGSIYMAGDPLAKEQLKDALINLQLIVIAGLRSVILDEKDPDYDAIQAASDDCRVNVGVCLGQLSQRMSRAARGQSSPGNMHIYDNPQAKPIHRSPSHSTQSSANTKNTPMTPPESDTEYLADAGTGTFQRRQKNFARAPDLDVMDVMHTGSYIGLYSPSQDNSMNGHGMHQRSVTLPLPRGMESPISPQEMTHSGARARDSTIRDSIVSTLSSHGNHLSLYQTQPVQQQTAQEGLGVSDIPGNTNSWNGYFGPHANDPPKLGSYSELTSATLGRNPAIPGLFAVNRKAVSPTLTGSTVQSPTSMSQYHRASIPEEPERVEKEVYFPPPIPGRSQSHAPSYTRTESVASNDVLHRNASISYSTTGLRPNSQASNDTQLHRLGGPLGLPTEQNLQGFCKGAFRLQCGLEKKAFRVNNRPLGYASMVQYWKCDKCYFEGQCTTIIPPGGKKPEKCFDPTVLNSEGIRYKWKFVAKCHVPLKSMPEGKRDGLYGSFCCIFCTAEGAQRGWPSSQAGHISSDRASIQSIKSSNSNSSNNNTLVFGNIHSFLDHLQMHREQEFWPSIIMQEKMRCIVGRIATRGEDFDINLLPLM